MTSPARIIVAAIVLSLSAVSGGNADSRSSLAEFPRFEQMAPGAVARAPFSDPGDPPSMPRRTAQRPNIASTSAVCGNANLSSLTESVYVSPEGTDSASCGDTPATACRTIHQGIANCTGDGCGVLVRWGLYGPGTTIELVDGVSLYGGCRFDDSTSQPYRTILKAPLGGKPAISARNVNAATMLYGFVILGSDATSPGQASIAMTVSTSTGLTIQNSVLVAGKGADGSNGTNPSQASRGGKGYPATSNPFGSEAGAGGQACPSQTPATTAGNGGDGSDERDFTIPEACGFYCDCKPKITGTGHDGGDSGTTKGGTGGRTGGNGCGCAGSNGVPDGLTGNNGAEGPCASVGGSADENIWGLFAGSNWSPGSGGTGQTGEVGSGGGGGGAGGIAVHIVLLLPQNLWPGLPGGGGGGGGCGGYGGFGGQQGGASVPLVLVSSNVKLMQNSLVPSFGGKGGMGGTGGLGGPGGEYGLGVTGHYDDKFINALVCNATPPGSGGAGGSGGQGGAGAGGAGGNGGPSIGIALVGGSPAPANDDGIYAGHGGAPGLKGPGGKNTSVSCMGATGVDGKNGGKASWHVF